MLLGSSTFAAADGLQQSGGHLPSQTALCIPCRAIEAAADGCSDVVGMAYWWSNCIQLRWMLWAMCHGGGMGDEGGNDAEATGDEFGWVMQVTHSSTCWAVANLPLERLWCVVLACCVKVVLCMQGP